MFWLTRISIHASFAIGLSDKFRIYASQRKTTPCQWKMVVENFLLRANQTKRPLGRKTGYELNFGWLEPTNISKNLEGISLLECTVNLLSFSFWLKLNSTSFFSKGENFLIFPPLVAPTYFPAPVPRRVVSHAFKRSLLFPRLPSASRSCNPSSISFSFLVLRARSFPPP